MIPSRSPKKEHIKVLQNIPNMLKSVQQENKQSKQATRSYEKTSWNSKNTTNSLRNEKKKQRSYKNSSSKDQNLSQDLTVQQNKQTKQTRTQIKLKGRFPPINQHQKINSLCAVQKQSSNDQIKQQQQPNQLYFQKREFELYKKEALLQIQRNELSIEKRELQIEKKEIKFKEIENQQKSLLQTIEILKMRLQLQVKQKISLQKKLKQQTIQLGKQQLEQEKPTIPCSPEVTRPKTQARDMCQKDNY